ncbi:flagellar hook-associated protein FlgL [Clostridium tagluense]|uniref:Flagellin n=1 Tax=Clostridium tagluense TaxID=360422 RepID=A0A401UHJ6_9CLOT|nr:flagellar hook-associated protein FlgL [Clostridium tagluense]GCD09028.1 hypothetical protein Ctaglu_06510 [Clostridium tagluense]
MRVTNKTLSDDFLTDMRTNLNNMNTLQSQMTSGKQIRKASDDPFKATRIMQMYSDIDANKQYNNNIKDSINFLDTTDTALGQVGNVVGRIEELLVSSGNGSYSINERKAIKDEINQRIGEISQILNTSFDGKYIFGGADGTSKPAGTKTLGENTELVSNIKPKVATKLTPGTMTSANGLKGDMSGVTFGTDKFNIDGAEITVDWNAALTADQKTQINANLSSASNSTLDSIKDIFVSKINSAIDASGKGVSHINGYLDKDNKMVLQSGSTGMKSEVTLNAGGLNTSIGAKILSNTGGTANKGAYIYNGKTVVAGGTFNISLNGVPMPVTIDPGITSGTTTMEVVATTLQTNINTAITASNNATAPPGVIQPVTVKETADGTFEIGSTSGAITFSDIGNGTTTKDLGLSQGPNMLLVEVSQGVTMDYNITASQVINYGTGTDNLMDLLKNITDHLDSADPDKVKELTKTDLTGIKAAMTNVLKLRSEVGAKQNRMESAEDRNVEANFNMTEILSRTQDIDITEKTMEFATLQTVYMASLQTSAKVLQPSLMDYLR